MIRDCVTCGQPTILGRYVDGHLIVLDQEPAASGEVVLWGDLNDQPTALYGVETEDDARFWGVTLDGGRYDVHQCPKEER